VPPECRRDRDIWIICMLCNFIIAFTISFFLYFILIIIYWHCSLYVFVVWFYHYLFIGTLALIIITTVCYIHCHFLVILGINYELWSWDFN
jgi:hypothetical protein